jgi:hypothetical protein
LVQLYKKHHDRGLEIVSISQESVALLRSFIEEEGVPFPVLSDPQLAAFGAYQVEMLPRTLLVNRDGNVTAIVPGYKEDTFTDQFVPMVEKMLDQSRAALDREGDRDHSQPASLETQGTAVGANLVFALRGQPARGRTQGSPLRSGASCRGVFGSPQALWEKGLTLREAGIDAVFVGHGSLTEAIVARCHREGARVFAEFGVFQGKKVAGARPELWPIGADGKRLEPDDWYLGLCPNIDAYRKEKLAEITKTAQKLAIDGVWLDFIRFPGHWEVRAPRLEQSCFCDASLKQFARAARLTLPPGDTRARATWILREHGEAWTRWKCARIAGFARDARRALKAARPTPTLRVGTRLLGAFVVPWRAGERDGAIRAILGQEFALLARHVDVFSPMVYHRMVGHPVAWVGEIAADLRAATDKPVWPIVQAVDAPKGETVAPGELAQALQESFAHGDGALVFTLDALLQQPAKRSAMTAIYTARRSVELTD